MDFPSMHISDAMSSRLRCDSFSLIDLDRNRLISVKEHHCFDISLFQYCCPHWNVQQMTEHSKWFGVLWTCRDFRENWNNARYFDRRSLVKRQPSNSKINTLNLKCARVKPYSRRQINILWFLIQNKTKMRSKMNPSENGTFKTGRWMFAKNA